MFAQPGRSDLLQVLRNEGEVHLQVPFLYPQMASHLARFTSVVSVKPDSILCNVNEKEYLELIRQGIPHAFHPIHRYADAELMGTAGEGISSWNYYPTYSQYDSIMYGFSVQYPALCTTSNILTLNSGRKLLLVKLTSSVNPPGGKVKFLYTSTMHGNETAGYILMLRLIDHLLQGYGIDAEATWLLDHLELWVCPLANPDGTYYGGNHTVAQAIRRNANLVDLNRNYPDPRVGANPDGNPYQPETVAFMGFADTIPFVMGANLHSGAEVVNFPWDTWIKSHPDDAWWRLTSRRYADTVQFLSPSGFFTDLDNGITNGAAWYVITGGRQDYMNYFAGCREVTLEVSGNFIEPVSKLNDMWNYHHRSLINYLKESWYGLRGTVTDSVSALPLRARVWINQHDADSSHVWSLTGSGHYYRPLFQGTYTVTWSAPGYVSKTRSVQISADDTTLVDVQLVPVGYSVQNESNRSKCLFWYDRANQKVIFSEIPEDGSVLHVFSADGREVQRIKNPRMQQSLLLDPGIWLMVLQCPDGIRPARRIFVH